MNKSGAAQVATSARQSQAAMRRVSEAAKRSAACSHDHTETVTGEGYELEHCTECDAYGPFAK